jgi:hypothetical protein
VYDHFILAALSARLSAAFMAAFPPSSPGMVVLEESCPRILKVIGSTSYFLFLFSSLYSYLGRSRSGFLTTRCPSLPPWMDPPRPPRISPHSLLLW